MAATWLSGTAFASPGPMLIATKTVVTGTAQQPNDSLGAVLKVTVQVTAVGGSSAPVGDVIVNAGPSNNCAASVSGPSGSTVSTGSCEVHNLSDQTYNVTATYRGSGNWSASSTTSNDEVTLDAAPAITSGTPAEKATGGEDYQFTFSASGSPAPTYKLGANAPGWLSINGSTGAVSGTVPSSIGQFTYSVIASNSVGTATAGPYTVYVTSSNNQSDVVTQLSCSHSVSIYNSGSCTLTVTNDGSSSATGITARIALPRQLSARSCGHGWGWGWFTGRAGGCSLKGNTATWQIGWLAAGASKSETLRFSARQGGYSWGFGNHHRFNRVTVWGSASLSSQSTSVSKATVVIYPRYGWFW
jgi:Domain of unknown function DUF11/Putative Ig domain